MTGKLLTLLQVRRGQPGSPPNGETVLRTPLATHSVRPPRSAVEPETTPGPSLARPRPDRLAQDLGLGNKERPDPSDRRPSSSRRGQAGPFPRPPTHAAPATGRVRPPTSPDVIGTPAEEGVRLGSPSVNAPAARPHLAPGAPEPRAPSGPRPPLPPPPAPPS